jgi:hypothetical protein
MPRTYLLSRNIDPLLGTFTGFLAYFLSESNPRTNLQPGHSLLELVPWQWQEFRRGREVLRMEEERKEAARGGGVDWDGVRREFESPQGK